MKKASVGSPVLMSLLFIMYSHGQAPANPKELLERIEDTVAPRIEGWCQGKFEYPPNCTVLRVFKLEGVCEVWAKNPEMERMEKLADVPICAMDREPGPKLRQGDGKTPEGFYTGDFGFWSRYWWMWIEVGESTLDETGSVGRGSAFKICLDYPNALDRKRSLNCGLHRPGSAICVHGNCVTAGCVSFENRDFLPVFAFARHHDKTKYGPLQVHIFPFRFEKWDRDARLKLARNFIHADAFTALKLVGFWGNLEMGWKKFNEKRLPLVFSSTSTLSFEDRGDLVRELKVFLNERGFSFDRMDDIFDDPLRVAIKTIQTQAHLKVDGVVGANTLRHLRSLGFQGNFGYTFQ